MFGIFNRRASDKREQAKQVVVPIFNEDMALGTIGGRKVADLADEELKTLWYVLDKYMDTTTLGEIYCEMKQRGLHVLLPAELAIREAEITLQIHGKHGPVPPSSLAWTPDNVVYMDKV
jgi:uncharacterized protein (DUF3820 family)